MKTISLSDQQIKNALLFLDRVECKGLKEAVALVELASAFTFTQATGETQANNKK